MGDFPGNNFILTFVFLLLLLLLLFQGTKVDHSTPWGKIFSSMSFISLMLVHCAHNWGFWTLLTKIPSYMKTVLEFDIKQVSAQEINIFMRVLRFNLNPL